LALAAISISSGAHRDDAARGAREEIGLADEIGDEAVDRLIVKL
jgi:hypothetical protein